MDTFPSAVFLIAANLGNKGNIAGSRGARREGWDSTTWFLPQI